MAASAVASARCCWKLTRNSRPPAIKRRGTCCEAGHGFSTDPAAASWSRPPRAPKRPMQPPAAQAGEHDATLVLRIRRLAGPRRRREHLGIHAGQISTAAHRVRSSHRPSITPATDLDRGIKMAMRTAPRNDAVTANHWRVKAIFIAHCRGQLRHARTGDEPEEGMLAAHRCAADVVTVVEPSSGRLR